MKKINYVIGFDVDKQELDKVNSTFKSLSSSLSGQMRSKDSQTKKELQEQLNMVKQVQSAWNQAYDNDLGQLSIKKFNTKINETIGSAKEVANAFSSMGPKGSKAFEQITYAISSANLQLRESNKFLDRLSTTIGNTVRYSMSSAILNNFTSSFSQAWNFTKSLDRSLNDIRIVTNKSADDMERFANSANIAGKTLHASTIDYTDASLVYYQQGLGEKEVESRTETTLKAANVTGQDAQKVSELLTSVWNGYKVSAEESELYIDKLAKVAAESASNLNELAIGMSKTASAAKVVGVDVDQLNGILSTVISTTKQAPEQIGNAAKSIFSRMGDLKMEGNEVELGKVTSTLENLGVEILDRTGEMRNLGEVIEEVGNRWNSWNKAEKQAIAIELAGKRQYNVLMSLFESWEMYNKQVAASESAFGTLQDQQDIYAESTAAALQDVRTELQETYQLFFSPDAQKQVYKMGDSIISMFNRVVESVGGGLFSAIDIGSTLMKVFSPQVSSFIQAIWGRLTETRDVNIGREQVQGFINEYREQVPEEERDQADNEAIKRLEKMKEVTLSLSDAERERTNIKIREQAETEKELRTLQEEQQELLKNAGGNEWNTPHSQKGQQILEELQTRKQALLVQEKALEEESHRILRRAQDPANALKYNLFEDEDFDLASRNIRNLERDLDQLQGKINSIVNIQKTNFKDVDNPKMKKHFKEVNQEAQRLKEIVVTIKKALSGNSQELKEILQIQKELNQEEEEFQKLSQSSEERQVEKERATKAMIKAEKELIAAEKKVKKASEKGDIWDIKKAQELETHAIKKMERAEKKIQSLSQETTNQLLKQSQARKDILEQELQKKIGSSFDKTEVEKVVPLIQELATGYQSLSSETQNYSSTVKEENEILEQNVEIKRKELEYEKQSLDADLEKRAKQKEREETLRQTAIAVQVLNTVMSASKVLFDENTSSAEKFGNTLLILSNQMMMNLPTLANLLKNQEVTWEKIFGLFSFFNPTSFKKGAKEGFEEISEGAIKTAKTVGEAGQGTAALVGTSFKALGSNLKSLGSKILAFFTGPAGIAVVITAAVFSIGQIAKKKAEESKKEMEEVSRQWAAFHSQSDEQSKKIGELESQKEEFESLSKGVDQYGKNLTLTNHEYTRYKEMVSQVAALNPEIVRGYNAEGAAILDKNHKLEDTIKLLKEESKVKRQELVTPDKIEKRLKGFDSSKEDIEKRKKRKYKDLREKIQMKGLLIDVDQLKDQKAIDSAVENQGKMSEYAKKNANKLKSIGYELVQEKAFIDAEFAKEINKSDNQLLELLMMDLYANEGFDKYSEARRMALSQAVEEVDVSDKKSYKDKYTEKKKVAKKFNQAMTSSNIDDDVLKDTEKWRQRTIKKRYSEAQDEIKKKREEFKTKLKGSSLSKSEKTDLVNGFLGFDEEDLTTQIDVLNKKMKEKDIDAKAEDLFTINELSNSFQNLGDLISSSADFDTLTSSLSKMRMSEEMVEAYQEIDKIRNNLEQLDVLMDKIFNKKHLNKKELEEVNIMFTDTISKMKSFENEALSGENVKQAESSLERLEQAQEIVNNRTYDGTQRQIEAYKTLRSVMDFNLAIEQTKQLKAAAERVFNTISSFDENISDEKFQELVAQINDFASLDHQINVDVVTSGVQDLQEMSAKFDHLNRDLAVFSENGVIAAEDVMEAMVNFPQVFDDTVKILKDGSVELNQETVKNFTDGKKAEVMAEMESTKNKLALEKQALETKAEGYRMMSKGVRQILKKGVNDNKDAAKNNEKIAIGLAKVQQGQSELTNSKLSDDVSNFSVTFGNMQKANADNSTRAANQMGKAYINSIAQIGENLNRMHLAIKNRSAMTTKKFTGAGSLTEVVAGAKEEIDKEVRETKKLIENLDSMDSNSLEDTADFFEGQADSAQKAADRIGAQMGMIDKIGQKALGNLGSIGSGKGSLFNKNGHRRKEPRKSKGGKGGKSSKDSLDTSREKVLDYSKEEKDIYHDINFLLEENKDLISKVGKEKKKYITGDFLKALEHEQQLYAQQQKYLRDKIDLQYEDLKNKQIELANSGIAVDDQGHIINYLDRLSKAQNSVNNRISSYNQLAKQYNSITDKETKKNMKEVLKLKKEEINKEKKAYKELEKRMIAYDKLQKEIMQTEGSLQDMIDKQVSSQIEGYTYRIKIAFEVDDFVKDYDSFRDKVIDKLKEDDFLGIGKSLIRNFDRYYAESGQGLVQQLAEHVRSTQLEISKMSKGEVSDIFGIDMEKAKKDLNNYSKKLMQALREVEETSQKIHEQYLHAIDKGKKAFDDQLKQYQYLNDVLAHDISLIELLNLGEDEGYQARMSYYDQQHQNNKETLDFQRKETQMWEELTKSAEEGSEEWEKFRDNWQKSIQELNSSIKSSIEGLIKQYDETIEHISQTSKDKLFGGDYSKTREEWERIKEYNDDYVDHLTRANELLKIRNKLDDLLNDADNPKKHQELKEFQEFELDFLSKKQNLSKYDLLYANKKIEVLEKQMALENSMNNKNKLRLRRDSQGNYSYQYVADEDEAKSKLEEYQQALEELRQLPMEEFGENVDKIGSKVDEFYQKLGELAREHRGDQEAYQEAAQELYDEYYGDGGYITELMTQQSQVQKDLQEATYAQLAALRESEREDFQRFLGLNDAEDPDSLLGAINALLGEEGEVPSLLEQFTKGSAQEAFSNLNDQNYQALIGGKDSFLNIWQTVFGNIQDSYEEEFLPTIINGMESMFEANRKYEDSLDAVERQAGISFSNIAAATDVISEKTERFIMDNTYLVSMYGQEIQAVAALQAELQGLGNQYDFVRQEAIQAANAAYAYYQALQGNFDGKELYDPNKFSARRQAEAEKRKKEEAERKPDAPTSSKGGSGSFKIGDKVKFLNGQYLYDSEGRRPAGSKYHGEYLYISNIANGRFHLSKGTSNINNGNARVGWVNRDQISYDTGGYTGDWGDKQGRLAFLHPKELVLNKDDTKNTLDTVKIVRDFSNKLTQLQNSQIRSFKNSARIDVPNNIGESFEQQVHIKADFPNVQSAKEIELALNNLNNVALQRANRKKYLK